MVFTSAGNCKAAWKLKGTFQRENGPKRTKIRARARPSLHVNWQPLSRAVPSSFGSRRKRSCIKQETPLFLFSSFSPFDSYPLSCLFRRRNALPTSDRPLIYQFFLRTFSPLRTLLQIAVHHLHRHCCPSTHVGFDYYIYIQIHTYLLERYFPNNKK